MKGPALLLLLLGLSGCDLNLGNDSGVSGKRFFVTSQTYDGNLGGLGGADLKCQLAANGAALSGTWKAWLSDAGTNAVSRLQIGYPLVTVSNLTIFNSQSDRTSGTAMNAPNRDEFGNVVSSMTVWTNSDSFGYGLGQDCNAWSSNSSGLSGGIGAANTTSGMQWTQSSTLGCNSTARLYCLEQ